MINIVANPEIDFVLVNNDVSDRPLLDMLRNITNKKLISPGKNIGFGAANNLAANSIESDYICFLNPDTIIKEDFLSPIIDFISQNPDSGACAPMLIYDNDYYQNSFGFRMGILYEIMESFMIMPYFRKLMMKKVTGMESKISHKVGWVSGACMIIKKKVFDDVGGFDERFFLNYEDIDFCRRLEDKGYKNYYFPHLKCTHLDHKSFDSNYKLLVFTRYQSRLIYAKKHYSFTFKIIVRFIHIIGLIFRLILLNFKYGKSERSGRRAGYFKSLKLYLGL